MWRIKEQNNEEFLIISASLKEKKKSHEYLTEPI